MLRSIGAGRHLQPPHVANGYYMLLSPLSVVSHTILVHVVSALGFEYFNTYNITGTN